MLGVSRHHRRVSTSETITVPSVRSSWKPAAGTGELASLVQVPPGVAAATTPAAGAVAEHHRRAHGDWLACCYGIAHPDYQRWKSVAMSGMEANNPYASSQCVRRRHVDRHRISARTDRGRLAFQCGRQVQGGPVLSD